MSRRDVNILYSDELKSASGRSPSYNAIFTVSCRKLVVAVCEHRTAAPYAVECDSKENGVRGKSM